MGYRLAQSLPPPFVTDPASDPDLQAGLEALLELRAPPGEAMQDRSGNLWERGPQHVHEVAVGLTLVQEQWLVMVDCQLQLALEGKSLLVPRREVAKVVETTLAHGGHQRVCQELTQCRYDLGVDPTGVMRVDSRGSAEDGWPRFAQHDRGLDARQAAAGNYHVVDAGSECGINHGFPIVIVAVMGEVDADVNQWCRVHHLSVNQPVGLSYH